MNLWDEIYNVASHGHSPYTAHTLDEFGILTLALLKVFDNFCKGGSSIGSALTPLSVQAVGFGETMSTMLEVTWVNNIMMSKVCVF